MWKIWIDRGGTFTDIIAYNNDGRLIVHKLLSENPTCYQDAIVTGIIHILKLKPDDPIPTDQIQSIKMGTTVATNALLERKGAPTLLLITQGFKDLLTIAYQNRPDIFALNIIRPTPLYQSVIEVPGRYNAQGQELIPLDLATIKPQLEQNYQKGIRSCAIALIHSDRYPNHEIKLAELAQEIGFTQISVSHQISPLIKIVSRGDTTVVDAYLSPILNRYLEGIRIAIGGTLPPMMLMQSNGGLVKWNQLKGKDAILSGPAGGLVGAVQVSLMAGFKSIITFDMGGTSTDVAHYHHKTDLAIPEYERQLETEIAGVRLRTPMMAIDTVAAGGSSIISWDGTKYKVGPASAGAHPGPACYGKSGPLTITDCNLLLGKISPLFFPKIFGQLGNQPLNKEIVIQQFRNLQSQIKDGRNLEQIAQSFIMIAVDIMSSAIKRITLQKGYNLSGYTLCCFGGAGGQHAALIAESLGIKQILIHPLAGVLSAYGIGLAQAREIREKGIVQILTHNLITHLDKWFEELEHNFSGIKLRKVYLRYEGSDFPLAVNFSTQSEMILNFEQLHRERYGFDIKDKSIVVELISVELIEIGEDIPQPNLKIATGQPLPFAKVLVYLKNQWHRTPVYRRTDLKIGHRISAPALIIEETGTNVLELGWEGIIAQGGNLILNYIGQTQENTATLNDPVLLSIFNNRYRAIALEMGITLQNTSFSVNIKERLDFSCAIFDQTGNLVANAPHIPVHVGSMSESIRSLIFSTQDIRPGDIFASNNPYNGGTHLPDITVMTPVWDNNEIAIIFWVASRGHHADIGGITPGSMPPFSQNIEEEGILLDNIRLVSQGIFQEELISEHLLNSKYPVRNLSQNLQDLKAQIAANEKGVRELKHLVKEYGLSIVQGYMICVQDNAEELTRRAIAKLDNGEFNYPTDEGALIKVKITINKPDREAIIDFTGTSPQRLSNFNAPKAVVIASVLYVFRTLIEADIPLNAGCLRPLDIIIPENSMLAPIYPAAVVAGNVETSQVITDALYGALGIMAASQGTMNNLTFGNNHYQYYETIAGGSGAGTTFDGTDAIQTHMTNSRITDIEILETRYPVIVEEFSIRDQSGGNGFYRGGNGVIRKIRFLEKFIVGILSSRRKIVPFGLKGGRSAKAGRNYLIRKDEPIKELGATDLVEVNPDDVIIIKTPGGGGTFEPPKSI